MKRLLHTLHIDLTRAFFSIEFVISFIGILIIYFIGVWDEIKFTKDVLSLFKYSSENSAFYILLVLVAVLPYTTSFCTDWNSQYFKLTIIRTGVSNYCFSKIVTCAVSAGISFIIGITLFIIVLLPWYPLASPVSGNFLFYSTMTLGGEFLVNGQYIRYFIIYIILSFFTGALWSAIGLYSSTFIPNKFVAICTPFIAYYVLNILTSNLPVWLRLNRISQGRCIIDGTAVSLAYFTILYTSLIVIIGFLFKRMLKRRLTNA